MPLSSSKQGATPTTTTIPNTGTASKSQSGCEQAIVSGSRLTKPYFLIKPTPTYTPDSSSDSETDSELCADPAGHPDSENDQILFSNTQKLPDLGPSLELTSEESHNAVNYQQLDYHSTDNQSNEQVLVLYQPKLNDENYLQVGDAVLLVQGQYWCKVILDSHSGDQDEFQGSLYWNYSDPDGSNPTGSYLFPGQSWGVLRGP